MSNRLLEIVNEIKSKSSHSSAKPSAIERDISEHSHNQCVTPTIDGDQSTLVLIEKRPLIRECLARCIGAEFGLPMVSFSDIDSWRKSAQAMRASLFIISGDGRDYADICDLAKSHEDAPIVILSDASGFDDVTSILRCGARGYVPTTNTLEVAIEAMRFVLFGGVFVPADIFTNARSSTSAAGSENKQNSAYTARQTSVINALREGKANKVIAYELNMSESTVKVHIHNVMKKLQVKNRTEMAVKLAEQFRGLASRGELADLPFTS